MEGLRILEGIIHFSSKLFHMFGCMQDDQAKLAETMLKIGNWLKDYVPLVTVSSDIVELVCWLFEL